jgi:biopolymer transport protein ExbB
MGLEESACGHANAMGVPESPIRLWAKSPTRSWRNCSRWNSRPVFRPGRCAAKGPVLVGSGLSAAFLLGMPLATPVKQMIAKITQAMVHSGATWVLWVLLAISVLSIAVGIERAWVLRGARARMTTLAVGLRDTLAQAGPRAGLSLLDGGHDTPSLVARAGLLAASDGRSAAEEAMAATIGLEKKRLEARLLFLGTVGNNAPFLGLLGTVIGVIGAFTELGKAHGLAGPETAGMAPEGVMASIAEALVATAIGLVVAIPAVAMFNALQGRVAAVLADAETLGHVVLAHLEAKAVASTPTDMSAPDRSDHSQPTGQAAA